MEDKLHTLFVFGKAFCENFAKFLGRRDSNVLFLYTTKTVIEYVNRSLISQSMSNDC